MRSPILLFFRWLFFLLTALSPFWALSEASAQGRCESVYHSDLVKKRQAQIDAHFKKTLLGDGANGALTEVYFYWHTAYPFQLQRGSDFRMRTQYSHKRMRVYRNTQNLETSVSGLDVIATFAGSKGRSNQEILEGYLNVYRKQAGDQVIEAIRSLEEVMISVAEPRQSFGFVATGPSQMGGELLGTFRVYNGVPSHTDTPAYLPLEYSLAKNKVATKTAQKLEQMRRQNPNALLFELGRLSIHGPAQVNVRTKTLLDLFLLRRYLDVLPDDALFYAHCASETLARANRQHYGFEIVEEVAVPGKGTQYILEATARKIRETFEKRYSLPALGIEILHP